MIIKSEEPKILDEETKEITLTDAQKIFNAEILQYDTSLGTTASIAGAIEGAKQLHKEIPLGLQESLGQALFVAGETVDRMPALLPFGNKIWGGNEEITLGGTLKKAGQWNIETANRNLEALRKEYEASAIKLSEEDFDSWAYRITGGAINYGTMLGLSAINPAAGLGYMGALTLATETIEGAEQYKKEHGSLDGFAGKSAEQLALNVGNTVVQLGLERVFGAPAQLKRFRSAREIFKAGGRGALDEFVTENLQGGVDALFDKIGGRFQGDETIWTRLQDNFRDTVVAAMFGGGAGMSFAIYNRSRGIEIMKEIIPEDVKVESRDALAKELYDDGINTVQGAVTKMLEQSSELKARHGELYDRLRDSISQQIKEAGALQDKSEMMVAQYVESVAKTEADKAVIEAGKRGVFIDEVLNPDDVVFENGEIYLDAKKKKSDLSFKEQEFFQVADEMSRLDDIYPEYKGETLNINGVEKTVYNSNGDRIAMSEPALRNFYKWFGDSKAVDEQGRPLSLFRGDLEDIEIFDESKQRGGNLGRAFYFTTDKEYARQYSGYNETGREPRAYYLKLNNPLIVGKEGYVRAILNNFPDAGNLNTQQQIKEFLQDKGIDGVIWDRGNKVEYAVYSPKQIKSTSNRGTFSESENTYYQVGDASKPYSNKQLERLLENPKENKEAILDVYENYLDMYNDILASRVRTVAMVDLGAKYKSTNRERLDWFREQRNAGLSNLKLPKIITMQQLEKVLKDNDITVKNTYIANTGSQYVTVIDPRNEEEVVRISIRDHFNHTTDRSQADTDFDLMVDKSNNWQDTFEDLADRLGLKGAFVTKVKKYNKLKSDNIYYKFEDIGRGVKYSKSFYDLKTLLSTMPKDSDIRIMYDKEKGYWFAGKSYDVIHNDMIQEAFKSGLYPDFNSSYDAQAYFDEAVYNDETLYRFIAMSYDNGNYQKAIDNMNDDYSRAYVIPIKDNNGVVLFSRYESDIKEAGLYDITKNATVIDVVNNKVLSNPNYDIVHQKSKKQNKIKGSFNALTKSIKITSEADFSIYQHEFAHFWLDNIWNYANSGLASEKYLKQFNELKKWLGVKGKRLSRNATEKFARGYEKFLFDRASAPAAIGDVFDEYEKFIREVYSDITEIDTRAGVQYEPVSQEAYNFFDSMTSGYLPNYAIDGGEKQEEKTLQEEKSEQKEESKTKERGLAKTTREMAKEKDIDVEVPTYEKRSSIEMGKKADELIKRDKQLAIDIVKGLKPEQDGLYRQDLFAALRELALNEGDSDLLNDLSRSMTVEEATELGQRIQSLARGRIDPVKQMAELREERMKKNKLDKKKLKDEIKRGSKEIQKEIEQASTPKEWADFIKSLEC